MKTPEEVLARARELAAEGYGEIPLHLLLGPRWETNSPEMEALRSLLAADLLRWTEAPGFLVLTDWARTAAQATPETGEPGPIAGGRRPAPAKSGL